MSEVAVVLDDRARLVTAVLAAGGWPEREQAQLGHAVHPHAKQTRHQVRDLAGHAAVVGADQMLAAGVPVDDLFTAAMSSAWPSLEPEASLPAAVTPAWLPALADFYQEAGLAAFWAEHEAAWAEAQADLVAIFQGSQLAGFLEQLNQRAAGRQRPGPRPIAIMPNLVYPALASVLATPPVTLYLILPPPKAVGESPPWPYAEDPGWVRAQACQRLIAYLLADTLAQLDPARQALLTHAAVVLFQEQAGDEAEAMAYLVRTKKEQRLPQLPLVVEQLRQYLAAPHGRSLLDLAF